MNKPNINNGGNAFPQNIAFDPMGNPCIASHYIGSYEKAEGMSYRQWLAGMAINGLLSNTRYAFDKGSGIDGAAEDSLAIADAIISRLEKNE